MKEKNRMSRGKIKIILFLIVFLLTLAVVCNLLIDLSEQKAAANATPAPIVTGSDNPSSSGTVVVETAPPVTIAPDAQAGLLGAHHAHRPRCARKRHPRPVRVHTSCPDRNSRPRGYGHWLRPVHVRHGTAHQHYCRLDGHRR